jgi:streptogramin lyase
MFSVAQFGVMEQLSFGPDGTAYWCTRGPSIGMYAPPYATANKTWKTIAGAKIFGIALDPKSNVLYAGSREAPDKMYKIPTANPGMMTSVNLVGNNGINGVTLGPDGNVVYVDQVTGDVYRLGPSDTTPTKVSTTPVMQPNDIAFGPDGLLYITRWTPTATITRLHLQNGMEMSRDTDWVTVQAGGGAAATHGDGIAFDSAGNLYTAAQALYMITPSKQVTMVAPTAGAGIEFGCGALSCNDLFYSSGTAVVMYKAPNPGFAVPWHIQ